MPPKLLDRDEVFRAVAESDKGNGHHLLSGDLVVTCTVVVINVHQFHY